MQVVEVSLYPPLPISKDVTVVISVNGEGSLTLQEEKQQIQGNRRMLLLLRHQRRLQQQSGVEGAFVSFFLFASLLCHIS